jgi:DNA polymerase-3 subunit alpha
VDSSTRPVVHLHNHTTWSVRDGLQRLAPMVAAAAADGQPAIAVTDHGTLGASWKFAKVAEEAGIKPILGAELYLAFGKRGDNVMGAARDIDSEPDTGGGRSNDPGQPPKVIEKRNQHLTVLARNPEGWKNLLIVSNEAHDSFWSKPRADMDLLAQKSAGGILHNRGIGGPPGGGVWAQPPRRSTLPNQPTWAIYSCGPGTPISGSMQKRDASGFTASSIW